MVTAFVVVFTLGLLLMAGLVLDGGLTLARQGSGHRRRPSRRTRRRPGHRHPTYRATGQITLDPAQATADAEDYLRRGRATAATVT